MVSSIEHVCRSSFETTIFFFSPKGVCSESRIASSKNHPRPVARRWCHGRRCQPRATSSNWGDLTAGFFLLIREFPYIPGKFLVENVDFHENFTLKSAIQLPKKMVFICFFAYSSKDGPRKQVAT